MPNSINDVRCCTFETILRGHFAAHMKEAPSYYIGHADAAKCAQTFIAGVRLEGEGAACFSTVVKAVCKSLGIKPTPTGLASYLRPKA